jgi:hypothetical protein
MWFQLLLTVVQGGSGGGGDGGGGGDVVVVVVVMVVVVVVVVVVHVSREVYCKEGGMYKARMRRQYDVYCVWMHGEVLLRIIGSK